MLSFSNIFRRFFFVVLLIITVMFTTIYFYSVPLIQKVVLEIERNSAHLALNNAFELTNKMYSNLESFREQALKAHKQQLRAVVELTGANIQQAFKTSAETPNVNGQIPTEIYNVLNKFTYSNDGYVWVANSEGKLISHPDPTLQNIDIRNVMLDDEKTILENVIQSATREGEGFYRYKWKRPRDSAAVDKLSFVKFYPETGVIIGSGLYLDDIEKETQQRKQNAIDEIREALSEIRVAKTGYLFIFDKNGQIIAHPNSNIDQTNALELRNPITGLPIVSELIEIADTGKELNYKWDKPTDQGNYIYDKISLVRKLDGFGWYICSTVYLDELQYSSILLSQRILTIAFISILISISLAIFFINRITAPITQLANIAERVLRGDMSATSGICRNDEIGILAKTFDKMLKSLRNNIQTLDFTVKKRTRELAKLEERQRLILDALPAQIAYLDSELNYLFVNKGYADFINKNKNDIVGHPINSVLTSEMMEGIKNEIQRSLAGEKVVYEYSCFLKNKLIVTKRTLIPDIDSQGQVIGLLNLSLDITTEKEAERKLTEAQRISATGQLAGGLAHDFNNLLSVILGNLLAATEHYHSSIAGIDRYLMPAIRASRQGADITSRLLAFSRRQSLNPTLVDLSNLLPETIELLQNSLPDNIKIILQIRTQKKIFVDQNQLENALINLALNAKDAMSEGGSIEFRAHDCNITSQRYDKKFDEIVAAGEYIELQVIDNGDGFSEEAIEHAYEPFYTTKSNNQGSGLGLSMVYGFVKQSCGYISINSTPNEVTSISLLLPVNNTHTNARTNSLKRETSEEKNHLTLLVEDNYDVRTLIRSQLISLGYTVIEAADTDEAAHLITTLEGIGNLITDIRMPGTINGFELADMMRQTDPNASIVLISGYLYEELPEVECISNYTFLKKPFNKDALKKAIIDAKNYCPKNSSTK